MLSDDDAACVAVALTLCLNILSEIDAACVAIVYPVFKHVECYRRCLCGHRLTLCLNILSATDAA